MSATEGRIQSMTGFAQIVNRLSLGDSAAGENATLMLELRSVNSRYLDLTFKVADELRHFESLLREQISAKVKRGKLECRVSLKRDNPGQDGSLAANLLNKEALNTLLAANQQIISGGAAINLKIEPPNSIDILRWPGVWGTTITDATETLDESIITSKNSLLDRDKLVLIAEQALNEFSNSRLREGAQTSKVMLQYCDEIEKLVAGLEAKLPQINAEMQRRFSDKVWERLLGTSNELPKTAGAEKIENLLKTEEAQSRINQELVLMAMRADVSEEIIRLKAHIAELRKTLLGSGAVGKKLDFLMQEFNREANTLGSKAPNLEVSKASTELKLAIEQIREQVQNLE
jgi:uncharacterized protein (TIGR00255 family)